MNNSILLLLLLQGIDKLYYQAIAIIAPQSQATIHFPCDIPCQLGISQGKAFVDCTASTTKAFFPSLSLGYPKILCFR